MLDARSLRGGRRERRQRRSERTETALIYQLQACAERASASTMVLADQDGLLVASSQWGEDRSEELAAILPMLTLGTDFGGLMMNAMPGGPQVVVSSFRAAETDLYLCAIGDFSDQMHEEITTAKSGIRRILN